MLSKEKILKNLTGKDADIVAEEIKNKRLTVTEVAVFASTQSQKDSFLFYQGILKLQIPEPDQALERINYLKAANNAIIFALVLNMSEVAAILAKTVIDYVSENIFIAHSAACAFARVGEKEKALEMIKYAVDNDYEYIDRLEKEKDFDMLRKDHRFKALFSFPRVKKDDDDLVVTEKVGKEKVVFRLLDCKEQIAKREQETINYIKTHFKAIIKSSFKAILDYYKVHYQEYKEGVETEITDSDYTDILPKIDKKLKIEKYLSGLEIYVRSKGKRAEGDFGLVFECTWDVEHGVGVRFENFKLKSVGMQEVVDF